MKPKFSLKSVGYLTAVIALALVTWMTLKRATMRDAAIIALEQAGGQVTFESCRFPVTIRGLRSVVEIDIGKTHKNEIRKISGILQELRAGKTAALRPDPRHLVQHTLLFPEVKKLRLTQVDVGSEGFKIIGQLRALEDLVLTGSDLRDMDLNSLAGLSALTRLEVDGTHLTDAGLAKLSQFTALRHLTIGVHDVKGFSERKPLFTKRGLTHITELPHLESLRLRQVEIPEEIVAVFASKPQFTLVSEEVDGGMQNAEQME